MAEWTEARLELLRRMWAAGCTASAIARELGGVTRNAVMGKAHRLKLAGRASPIIRDHTAAKSPAPKRHNVVRPRTKLAAAQQRSETVKHRAAEPPKPQPRPAPVVRMNGREACRWPIGDPREAGFHFCEARPVVDGKPYCQAHCDAAYQRMPQPGELAGSEAA